MQRSMRLERQVEDETKQMETDMSERASDEAKALIAGLILSQQVLLEALVRQDAIGYHQVRTTLDDAMQAIEPVAGERPGAGLALRTMLDVLDDQHRPLGPEEKPHAVDWAERLRALMQEL